MSAETELLHAESPSRRNMQQRGSIPQQATQQTRNKPVSLKALAEGILAKEGRNSDRNNGATDLLHAGSVEGGLPQQVQQGDASASELSELTRVIHELATLEG